MSDHYSSELARIINCQTARIQCLEETIVRLEEKICNILNDCPVTIGKDAMGVDDGVTIGCEAIGSSESVVIGNHAESEGNTNNVVVGYMAKAESDSVTLGHFADSNGTGSIAIGKESISGGVNSIAIGKNSGSSSQGNFSIAIGYQADTTNSKDKTIILNASGDSLNNDNGVEEAFFVKPIRDAVSENGLTDLCYNPTTYEVVHQPKMIFTHTPTVTEVKLLSGGVTNMITTIQGENESYVIGYRQGGICEVYGTFVMRNITYAGTSRLNVFEFKSNVFPNIKNLSGCGRTPGTACVYLGSNLNNGTPPPVDVQSCRLILCVPSGTFNACVKFWTSGNIRAGTDVRIGWSLIYEIE